MARRLSSRAAAGYQPGNSSSSRAASAAEENSGRKAKHTALGSPPGRRSFQNPLPSGRQRQVCRQTASRRPEKTLNRRSARGKRESEWESEPEPGCLPRHPIQSNLRRIKPAPDATDWARKWPNWECVQRLSDSFKYCKNRMRTWHILCYCIHTPLEEVKIRDIEI